MWPGIWDYYSRILCGHYLSSGTTSALMHRHCIHVSLNLDAGMLMVKEQLLSGSGFLAFTITREHKLKGKLARGLIITAHLCVLQTGDTTFMLSSKGRKDL